MRKEVKAISGIVKIPLAGLHVQYIPWAEPERWWKDMGKGLMSLDGSPHVELIQIFMANSNDKQKRWELLMASRYAEERRFRFKCGQTKWTEQYLRVHIKHRIETYLTMKRRGWIGKLCKENPVRVLKEPFFVSRYGVSNPAVYGTEIWDGAGRCMAAFVLGWKEIDAQWCVDTEPGKCECKKIEKKWVESPTFKNGSL